MKNWTGVLKCQRPIVSSDVDSMMVCLFYNETRSIYFEQRLDEADMKKLFPNDALKTYWHVEISDDTLRFGTPAVEQPW